MARLQETIHSISLPVGVLALCGLFFLGLETSSTFARLADEIHQILVGGRTVPSTPEDSPVTVRGGSVSMRSMAPFDCKTVKTRCSIQSSSKDESEIQISGVVPKPGAGLLSQDLKPTNNWELVLTFHKYDGTGPETSHNLHICTTKTCSHDGPLSSGDGQIFFIEDQSDKNGDAWGNADFEEDIDGTAYHRKTYHVRQCPSSDIDTESVCNHIYDLTIYSTGLKEDKSTFRCPNGECTIGIGASQ